MYGQSVYGSPSGGIEADDSRSEGQAPREDEDEGIEVALEEMQWRRAGDRRSQHYQQHRHHYQHQGQRHQRQPRNSSKPKHKEQQSPLPSSSESPPARSTIDRLARKLSKQNLQLGSRFSGQSQGQQLGALPPLPPLSIPSLTPIMPERVVTSSSFPVLEVDDQPEEPVSAGPSSSSLPKVEDKRLEFRRLRRQTSAPLRSATPSNLRAIDARLSAMIANESQCIVRSEPVSTPSASTSATATFSEPQPPVIEADPDCSMPNWDTLEVDDDNTEGCESLPSDGSLPQRCQYVPGGIRKYSVGGVALRYRLSVDAALRCQNVVKNRPRMRRRDKDKSRHGSARSSAMTSAVTSAVHSPVIPPVTLSSSAFPPPPPPPRFE
ncbi:hypothetical protein QBC35DRAFT_377482 [Podospora australis]|uniref:Uncharacterized protein n=1 Tax=Podospora australis TaxID=1536484 RepID=A0AAN7ALN0_9PEZI|nr:hypothetical protein QBC35DRAFT_377482 [Podospora australis]